MLAPRTNNTSGKASSIASKITSSTNAVGTKPKKNFFAYSLSIIWQRLCWAWSKGRSFLWVFSTGFILLILPFTFAYISEFQKEAAKIMGANQSHFI